MPVNSFDNYHMAWKPELGDSSGPIYLSVAAMLERDILSGDLPRGVRLPPQRELADWLDIDLTTVTRAYNVCKEKNLIYGITGRGTFVLHEAFATILYSSSTKPATMLVPPRSIPSLYI